MQLSKSILSSIAAKENLLVPGNHLLQLPEKILQFGTGVLLRGLPDHLVHIANKQGCFNGRVVVVKSTTNGYTDAFDVQNGLYTLAVRGIDNGHKIAYDEIVSSISRVLSAQSEWEEILQCAANPSMQIIISNTTELGIVMEKDNVHASPPQTFPGKLLAFLYQRFKVFNGAADKGMVIVPTELIPDNADKLLAIVLEQAHLHGFEIAFIEWLEYANYFCNSLVDRIVPGKFSKEEQHENEVRLGYSDELMIMCEQYALWAIETKKPVVKELLSFASVNPQVVLADDIEKFKELKIRLLNGSHTFSCGLALLAGFKTVKEAMANNSFNYFITQLMQQEIAVAIESENISVQDAVVFAGQVLDRYRNPFIEHQWLSICTNYTSKMYMRNVPLLYQYAKKKSSVPELMSLGMAAHILYMRSKKAGDGNYYGNNGTAYLITDPNAAWYEWAWKQYGSEKIVEAVLTNSNIWQSNLIHIDGFKNEVNCWLQQLLQNGAIQTLQQIQSQNMVK